MLFPKEKRTKLKYETGGRPQEAAYAWYRGEHCNFNPRRENMFSETAINEFILKGWLPPAPMINKTTRITSFGSCFAKHIGDYLGARDYSILSRLFSRPNKNSYVITHAEGMVTTFAVRQQFEWAFENKVFREELWYGYEAEKYGYDEDVRQHTLELFRNTDIFIITLGLSEVWYDKVSGGVFWRAVPRGKYDPSRHVFRVSSHAENLDNLRAVYALIRKHRPEASIVMTLSPVPLVATFREQSCITANAVSKAILRAALDDLYREVRDDGKLFYWPAYEIVKEAFVNPFKIDRRHIKPAILDFIMRMFEEHYCADNGKRKSLLDAYILAQVGDGLYDKRLHQALDRGEISEVRAFVEKNQNTDCPEIVYPILRRWMELHPHGNDLDEMAETFDLAKI